jgi:hypothetical protein
MSDDLDDDDNDYDEEHDDNDYDEEHDDNDDGGYKCLTCEHWGGNAKFSGGNIESFRQATGKCFCKGTPHYYNNDRLTADDGCDSWNMHPLLR